MITPTPDPDDDPWLTQMKKPIDPFDRLAGSAYLGFFVATLIWTYCPSEHDTAWMMVAAIGGPVVGVMVGRWERCPRKV